MPPIIVIEGPKLKGMESVCSRLSSSLGATYLHSVPVCIRHLKKVFDSQPQLIRGAFYAISNYILGQELFTHPQTLPVLVDRYWNSTVAHGIVNEVGDGIGNLPPKNHTIYDWPVDLPQPTTVVLVSCRKKLREMKKNGPKRGKIAYENMIFETFRRMRNQSWIEVDCTKQGCTDTTDVVSHIIDRLQDKNIVSVDSQASLCPSMILHPKVPHDTLPVEMPSTSNHQLKFDAMSNLAFKSCLCPSVPS
ncbi:UMP-CMP kinase 2, mitochondrial-like [Anneissia japonica]|uniref:UMP-CMP kinase 2, mitochondrial-like n=1 Tax=Anneissia japonica TaxID=1529436 RepID=UPI001425B58B|nr:UMP-CMP kinase 2, mitochondrial-like [Anneissia japonica]